MSDRPLIRSGIRAALEGIAGMQIAGEAGDAREALLLAAESAAGVILAPLGGPAMAGLGLAGDLARNAPACGVVLVDDRAAKANAYLTFRAGARGYLAEADGPPGLEAAVRAVAAGWHYLSPAVTRDVLADLGLLGGREAIPPTALSPRQREVLRLIAQGLTAREIAAKLGVSAKTVEAHRTQLMTKLGVHKVAGLVRYALRHDILDDDPGVAES